MVTKARRRILEDVSTATVLLSEFVLVGNTGFYVFPRRVCYENVLEAKLLEIVSVLLSDIHWILILFEIYVVRRPLEYRLSR